MTNKRALLVGIDDYPGLASDLPSCTADVAAMAQVLRRSFDYEVETLLDGAVTQTALNASLDRLCRGAGAGDRVLFYYSGHGTTLPRRDTTEECLFLADGSVVPDDEFVRSFAALPAGAGLVVLDSCFSGGMAKFTAQIAAAPAPKYVTLLRPDAESVLRKSLMRRRFGRRLLGGAKSEAADRELNAVFLSACEEGETAMASTPATLGLSAFTYALLGAVARASSTSTVGAIAQAATRELRAIGMPQTPTISAPGTMRPDERIFPTLDLVGAPPTKWTWSSPLARVFA